MKKVTFEQRPEAIEEASNVGMCNKTLSGRGHSRCEDP